MSLGPIGPIPSPASVKSSTATLTGTSGGAVGPNSVGNINLAGTNVSIAGDPVTNTLTFTSAGGSGGGTVTTYVTNSGSATPNSVGTLNVTGNTSQGLTLSGAGNTVTVAGLDASDTAKGVVELATNAETIAGSSTTLVTTPAGVNAKLGTQTLNALPLGQGNTAALSWLGPLTDGQLLIGDTGGAPVAANITAGSNITVTNGAGTIQISATGALSSIIGLAGNTGSVTGLGGTVAVIGDNQSITTIGQPGGAGQSLTIALIAPVVVSYGGTGRQTLTQRSVLIGAGTAALAQSNVGANGTVLIAGGAGNDPAFAAITSTGQSLLSTTSVNGLNVDINPPVVVSYGGTGRQSLTANTVLVGAGTSPVTQLGPLTNGQLIIGQTGLAPVAATLSPGSNITITNAAGGITISAATAISILALFGNTGSATGLAGTVSVFGDTQSITTAGSGNSLTISLIAPVVVSYGGTGQQSLTQRSVLIGAGTAALAQSNVGANGTVLIGGGTGNDPAFATITSTGRSLTYTTSVNGFNLDIDSPVVVSYGGTGRQSLTANTVLVGAGTSPVTQLGPLTNGQLIIGQTGLAPVAATLSPGPNITITNAAGGITISAATAISILALFGNTGSATGLAGTVSVFGDTQSITTAGSGNSLTISLIAPVVVSYGGTGQQSLTQRSVLIGAGTAALAQSNVGANGTVLIGGGAGNDPAFATITSTGRSLTYTTSVNGFNLDIDSPVVVSYGGTGNRTLTSRTVLLGAGTFPVSVTNLGTLGQVLIGGGSGADPAFGTITSTGNTITFTYGTNTLNMEAAGAGSWTEVTGTFQQMLVSNSYIANNAAQVELLLPSISALGSMVRVSGKGAGGWRVSQTVSQVIHFGTHDTLTGLSGSISSTAARDGIELLCVVANTEWNVLSGIGNMAYS